MRRALILIAVIALIPAFPIAAGASDGPSFVPAPPRVTVTCWLGSEELVIPGDRVFPQGGGLRIEYEGRAQLTTVPCIARAPLGSDPNLTLPTDVYCLDHAGAVVYKAEIHQFGTSDGVLYWYEKDYDGYMLVLSTAPCWIGADVFGFEPTDAHERGG